MKAFALALAVLFAGLCCPGEATAQAPPRPRCASPEHRQFDFWAGEWDAYGLDEGNKLVARARVDVILDGCALLEVYEQLDGLNGRSFSIYDSTRRAWHQSWVTNRGKLLTLEGVLSTAEESISLPRTVTAGLDHGVAPDLKPFR